MDQDPAAWAPTPDSARWPGAGGNSTWDPVLTTGEFAAIRSTGFEVAGRVSGADTYSTTIVELGRCPSWHPVGTRRNRTPPTGVSSPGRPGASFEPLAEVLFSARHRAIGRVLEKARALGGHGVIGIRLESLQDPVWGLGFGATGIVVRAPGAPPSRSRLFTAQLSGQDFARLVTMGWIPVQLVLGVAIGVRHATDAIIGQSTRTEDPREWDRFYTKLGEDKDITDLVSVTRQEARRELARQAQRLGAHGVVQAGQDLRLFHRECPAYEGARENCAEVISIGTAITRFAETTPAAGSPPLTVMSVDPRRRRYGRWPDFKPEHREPGTT